MTEKELMNYLISEQKEFRQDIKKLIEESAKTNISLSHIADNICNMAKTQKEHEKEITILKANKFKFNSSNVKIIIFIITTILAIAGISIIP